MASEPTIIMQDQTLFAQRSEPCHFHVNANAHLTVVDILVDEPDRKIEIELVGEHASCTMLAILLCKGSEQLRVRHTIIHKAEHTTSTIQTKGIVIDASRVNYDAITSIIAQASDSHGEQSIDFIIGSKDARVEAVPHLDIHNKDVRSSHAVTVTRLREETLFYLQSRGLNTKTAEHTVLSAHVEPIIGQLTDAQAVQSMRDTMSDFLESYG